MLTLYTIIKERRHWSNRRNGTGTIPYTTEENDNKERKLEAIITRVNNNNKQRIGILIPTCGSKDQRSSVSPIELFRGRVRERFGVGRSSPASDGAASSRAWRVTQVCRPVGQWLGMQAKCLSQTTAGRSTIIQVPSSQLYVKLPRPARTTDNTPANSLPFLT
eukprot:12707495-Heterocapsa_arctica.AAC.1